MLKIESRETLRLKRTGFHELGMLVVDINDPRIAWPEREMLKQIGEKLYGRLQCQEVPARKRA